jgi:hypothetical protein
LHVLSGSQYKQIIFHGFFLFAAHCCAVSATKCPILVEKNVPILIVTIGLMALIINTRGTDHIPLNNSTINLKNLLFSFLIVIPKKINT